MKQKEAFEMSDNFSEGRVFYTRSLAIIGAVLALAVLVHVL